MEEETLVCQSRSPDELREVFDLGFTTDHGIGVSGKLSLISLYHLIITIKGNNYFFGLGVLEIIKKTLEFRYYYND
jgi:hypothetical protein